MSSLDLIWDSLSIKDQVKIIRADQLKLILKVREIEMRPNPCLKMWLVLKEIGSLKEWMIALAVLALLLKGTISPADIKSIFLSAHGGE
jgi:hypothetical protein